MSKSCYLLLGLLGLSLTSSVFAATLGDLRVAAKETDPTKLAQVWPSYADAVNDNSKLLAAKREVLAIYMGLVDDTRNVPQAKAFLQYLTRDYPHLLEADDMQAPYVDAATRAAFAAVRPDLKPAQLRAADSDQELATLIAKYGPTLATSEKMRDHPDWSKSAISIVSHPLATAGMLRHVLESAENDAVRYIAIMRFPADKYVLLTCYQAARTNTGKMICAQILNPAWIQSTLERQPEIGSQLNVKTDRVFVETKDGLFEYDKATNTLTRTDNLMVEMARQEANMKRTADAQTAAVLAASPELAAPAWPDATALMVRAWYQRPVDNEGYHNASITAESINNSDLLSLAISHGDVRIQKVVASTKLARGDIADLAVCARSNEVLITLVENQTEAETVKTAVLENWRLTESDPANVLSQIFQKAPPTDSDLRTMIQAAFPEACLRLALKASDTVDMWREAGTATQINLAFEALAHQPNDYDTLRNVLTTHADTIVSERLMSEKTIIESNPNYAQAYQDLNLKEQGTKSTTVVDPRAAIQTNAVSAGFWKTPAGVTEETPSYVMPNAAGVAQQRAAIESQSENTSISDADSALKNYLSQKAAETAAETYKEQSAVVHVSAPVPVSGTSAQTIRQLPISALKQQISALEAQAAEERLSWEGRDDLAAITPSHAQWAKIPADAKRLPYFDATSNKLDYRQYLEDKWDEAYFSPTCRLQQLTAEKRRRGVMGE